MTACTSQIVTTEAINYMITICIICVHYNTIYCTLRRRIKDKNGTLSAIKILMSSMLYKNTAQGLTNTMQLR